MIRFKTSFFKIWLCLPICFFAGLLHKTSYVKGQENVGRQYDVLIQNPQILNAPQVVFLRQKNLMVYQTSEIYRGIDVKFPLKKTVTQFLFYHNDSWENTPMLLSDGAIDLILLGGNPINNILLLTDSKTRSRLYLLELNNKRTPVAKPVENFNNGGFPIHSATINQSGDVIIFSSARFGTHGGYDLFVAELSSKRRVTQIKNAGTKTNSPFDEIYPRFADENNHLYFATNFTSTPGFFQTIEARFENNQIIPISRFLPTDPSLNSICQIQTIDSALTLVTLFDRQQGFTQRFVSGKIPTEPNQQNPNNHDFKEPQWRKIRLQGYIKASVSQPIEVCLLDTLGNILSSTLSFSATWSFSQIPQSKFFVSFSSPEIIPKMAYLEISSEYSHPVYVFDISIEKRKYSSTGYAVVFNPIEFSPLQQMEIQSNLNLNPTSMKFTVISNQKAFSLNSPFFQNYSLFFPPYNFEIKPLIDSYANSPIPAGQKGCFIVEFKEISYPNYSVIPLQIESKSLLNQYTVIIGDEGETDPYSLISIAMANGNNSLFYNQSIEKEYCLGNFTNIDQAINMLRTVRKNGYPKAMLGRFDPKENSYIKIQENPKDQKNHNSVNNSTFCVEVYASTNLISPKTFPFSEKLNLIVDRNGVFHYIYEVETLAHADSLVAELKRQGYGNAAIVSVETNDLK